MTLALDYRSILKVALPLMGSSFIQSIVLLTDASFLSRYSTEAFDAAGNGGLMYITLLMVLIGLGDGAQIRIARRLGENQLDNIKHIFSSTITLLSISAVLLFAITYWIIPDALRSYSKHLDLAEGQITYLSYRSFGYFFGIIFFAFQGFYIARGKTWVVLVASALIAVTNIGLDRLLIFDEFSWGIEGLEGAGIASATAEFIGVVFFIWFSIASGDRKRFHLFEGTYFSLKILLETLKLSAPIILQGFLALATWTVFFTWIEQMGKFELTVSQNIRSMYFLAFVPLWGFAGTTKTYISQYLGANKPEEIPKIQRRIQLMTLGFMLVVFHGAILYPSTLISIINPSEIHLKTSAELLRFVSGSMFIFGFFSVYFQTINGSGNTLFTFYIEFFAVGVYILSAYLFIKILHWDIYWVWSVEYIYFLCMGIPSVLYLYLFDWKNKKI